MCVYCVVCVCARDDCIQQFNGANEAYIGLVRAHDQVRKKDGEHKSKE